MMHTAKIIEVTCDTCGHKFFLESDAVMVWCPECDTLISTSGREYEDYLLPDGPDMTH